MLKRYPFLGWFTTLRSFTLLLCVCTLLFAGIFYRIVFEDVTGTHSEDLYWSVAQLQIEAERLQSELWRYEAGQSSLDEVNIRLDVAYSKYLPFVTPSSVRDLLSGVPGFEGLRDTLHGFFSLKQHRAWSPQQVQQLSAEMDDLWPELVDYAVNAREVEINHRNARLVELQRQHVWVYGLGLAVWLFLAIGFWVLLHRYIVAQQAATSQRTLLERERAAREATLEAELAQSTFLATISHEIRSPLQTIQSCVELLEHRIDPTATYFSVLQRLKSSTDHLLAQVRDLLDISALKNRRLRLDPGQVDVVALAQEVVATLRLQADAKGLTVDLNTEVPHPLYLDGIRLRQILWNLTSNAIRYTDHGAVWVSLRQIQVESRNQLELVVRDSGVGIAPDMLKRIFQPFTQGKERRSGSSGLGLAIVKELTSLFGGTITVNSEPGLGSTFQVTLPVHAPSSFSTEGTGPKVLLVDDDTNIRESFEDLLSQEGYRVMTRDSVEAGLQAVQEQTFDAILLDLQLRDRSGYEVAEVARHSLANAGTPLIGMTAYKTEFGDRRAALLAAKLEKPVSLLQLRTVLQQYVPVPPA